MIFRAAVLERDGGTRVELEVLRLAESAAQPAGSALYMIEGDRPWSDEEVEAWALARHQDRMVSPRCGALLDLRPLAEIAWAGSRPPGWHEVWREALHLASENHHNWATGRTLCGRTIAAGWYAVGEVEHPRTVAELLPPWSSAGELRCKRCAASWEIAMLALRAADK